MVIQICFLISVCFMIGWLCSIQTAQEIDTVGTPTDEIRITNETILKGIKENLPKHDPDKCAMIYCIMDATTTDPENELRRICKPCRSLLVWSRKAMPGKN